MQDARDLRDTQQAAADSVAPSAPADEHWGWYLYGVTPAPEHTTGRTDDTDDAAGAGAATAAEGDEAGEALELIASGDLAAIVRRVPLAEFAPEALGAHADDPAWLETMARRHNAAVEAVHRTRTILPAKFGSVYARLEDVRTALVEEHDALLAGLNRIDGCDEWGVRLYGDLPTIRQRADDEQESVRRLREELASASPGRAYFLQRKLADERASAIDHVLDDLAGQAFEHFARHARAGQISRQLAGSRIPQDQRSAELLRAAFLVPHESADAFIEDVRQFSESQSGLWCEYSGPWPPYSFAAQTGEA
jgi:Gas vesicle synthesis protein GvpL/GvpF